MTIEIPVFIFQLTNVLLHFFETCVNVFFRQYSDAFSEYLGPRSRWLIKWCHIILHYRTVRPSVCVLV